MTYIHAEGAKIRLTHTLDDDLEVYISRLTALAEADAAYEAHRADLASTDLQPFFEASDAAAQDLADVFSETLTIEQASRLANQLFAAIIQAQVNRGDFNK